MQINPGAAAEISQGKIVRMKERPVVTAGGGNAVIAY
jgi:hypothetical protein